MYQEFNEYSSLIWQWTSSSCGQGRVCYNCGLLGQPASEKSSNLKGELLRWQKEGREGNKLNPRTLLNQDKQSKWAIHSPQKGWKDELQESVQSPFYVVKWFKWGKEMIAFEWWWPERWAPRYGKTRRVTGSTIFHALNDICVQIGSFTVKSEEERWAWICEQVYIKSRNVWTGAWLLVLRRLFLFIGLSIKDIITF